MKVIKMADVVLVCELVSLMVDDVTGWKNSGRHIAEFIHEAMTLAKGMIFYRILKEGKPNA